MNEIKNIYSKRKHVVIYDEEIIPTQIEIKELLETAYSLVTSNKKAFPYQINVLGPNKERSIELWKLCEQNNFNNLSNDGLLHIRTAPYTLIITPRMAPPNEYYKELFDIANEKWELDNAIFVNGNNRESGAIEIGMIAKVITGLLLEKGWDTSYNICFPKSMSKFAEYTFSKYNPTLMQTIGKAKKYKYEYRKPEELEKDTAPPFDDIFKFIDNN